MNAIWFSKHALAVVGLLALITASAVPTSAQLPGGTLDPTTIPKYVEPLPIPSVMPRAGTVGHDIDYYEIAVRQFQQQILPPGLPKTTVWGYGAVQDPGTFSYPARTIEADVERPVRVKWINDLKDAQGKFRPHLVPVDQTLHWANPPQDCLDGSHRTDCRGRSQQPYKGPVPIITHLHGSHVQPDSDGYPEAWYLPAAVNIPAGYATRGSNFDQIDGVPRESGAAVFQYPNDQRATTLWYHDHALGMTRANVYSGLAGFYLLRGGSLDTRLVEAFLPKDDFEIPIAIQDKSFNRDGSLFYPDNRAFFEGLNKPPRRPFLKIPFIPEPAAGGRSDVSPIWNPEFFGNTQVVNGKTWPNLNVERRRYRLRLLNGNDTRVLILKIVAGDPTARPGVPAVPFWQIGADGGFLPKPQKLDQLLIAGAERADVIVDFSNVPSGTELYLINEGPDEPFGGGTGCTSGPPDCDFPFADPGTTGQVMKITVGPRRSFDLSIPPELLVLPHLAKLGPASRTRTLSLNEAESATVFVVTLDDGSVVFRPSDPDAVPFGPTEALLGTARVTAGGIVTPTPLEWMEPITENPALNATEIWEIYNFTEDAHPIHIHLVQFEVVNRQDLAIENGTATLVPGTVRGPEPWETGTKDTALMFPGQVTRVKAKFDIPGLFVWHCHILSHEDNEMMRPYCVGDRANCKP
jgi:bilirubin oxidase